MEKDELIDILNNMGKTIECFCNYLKENYKDDLNSDQLLKDHLNGVENISFKLKCLRQEKRNNYDEYRLDRHIDEIIGKDKNGSSVKKLIAKMIYKEQKFAIYYPEEDAIFTVSLLDDVEKYKFVELFSKSEYKGIIELDKSKGSAFKINFVPSNVIVYEFVNAKGEVMQAIIEK